MSTVVGIYLERGGALAIFANADASQIPWPKVEFVDYEIVTWNASDPDEATRKIVELAVTISTLGDELKSVCVASYGPFLSLTFGSEDFGKLHPSNSHLPLQGFDLHNIFSTTLRQELGHSNVRLTFTTDANSCAVGEAVARDDPRSPRIDRVLVYLLITEGVGAGIVEGRRPIRSALHSEVGLLPVRFDPVDALKPDEHVRQFSRSLASFADNRSLVERYKKIYDVKGVTHDDLLNESNNTIWNLRAYYVAQACLACTALFAPHQLVVAGNIDPGLRLASKTRDQFGDFLADRLRLNDSVPEYAELNDVQTYISSPRPIPRMLEGLDHSIPVTGAAGACTLAALELPPYGKRQA